MSTEKTEGSNRKAMLRVAELVTEAIDLIDAYKGPPEAAIHLELSRQKVLQDLNTR